MVDFQRGIVCEGIRRAIIDERGAVSTYRNLENDITKIARDLDTKIPGTGAAILSNIDEIIKDETDHERRFSQIAIDIGCTIPPLK